MFHPTFVVVVLSHFGFLLRRFFGLVSEKFTVTVNGTASQTFSGEVSGTDSETVSRTVSGMVLEMVSETL